jgi:hypothetical protein
MVKLEILSELGKSGMASFFVLSLQKELRIESAKPMLIFRYHDIAQSLW